MHCATLSSGIIERAAGLQKNFAFAWALCSEPVQDHIFDKGEESGFRQERKASAQLGLH